MNVLYPFINVEPQVLDLIITKCNGNTLACLEFFHILLQNDFIQIQPGDNIYRCSLSLKNCMELSNFTSIPVPISAYKIRLEELDAYIKYGTNLDWTN